MSKDKIKASAIWILCIFIGIILLSISFDYMYYNPKDFKEGDCVIIDLGQNETFSGQIYTVQSRSRYTIHYLNYDGDVKRKTFKHFQISHCDDIIPEEIKDGVNEEIEDKINNY